MEDNFSVWIGIDWGTEEHQVCGVDDTGAKVFEWRVRHTGEDIGGFVERLLARVDGNAERVAAAIETPHGSIVESLIERGVAAFSINPKQLDRFRDRFTVSGAKSDKLDAFVLASTLRTDVRLYRRIELGDPALVELREMVRAREVLVAEGTAIGSRLREQIHRYYPQFLKLGSLYDDHWLCELLEMAPTPAAVKHLKRPKVESLLRKHHVRRLTSDAVLETLSTKPLSVAPGVVQAASAHVRLLLPTLHVNRTQRAHCERRIKELMEQVGRDPESDPSTPRKQHRDADILLSVAGLGVVTSATMLTEAATAIRDRDYHALRSQTGVAPVSSQTGKQQRPTVKMRRGCNPRLRVAVYHWTNVSMQRDARSREHYATLRRAGHTHGRALRGVADRLLKMLVAMLKSGTLYDPNRRSSALPAAA